VNLRKEPRSEEFRTVGKRLPAFGGLYPYWVRKLAGTRQLVGLFDGRGKKKEMEESMALERKKEPMMLWVV